MRRDRSLKIDTYTPPPTARTFSNQTFGPASKPTSMRALWLASNTTLSFSDWLSTNHPNAGFPAP